jgi:AraC-like DNA-binding protein
MDVLTDVLETVRVTAACSGRLELGSPWGVRIPASDDAGFHVVSHGHCHLEVEGVGGVRQLAAGDVVALPRGHAHTLRDAEGSPVLGPDELFAVSPCAAGAVLRAGGSGAKTVLLSGRFRFTDPQNNPLLAALPSVIHLAGDAARNTPWLETTLGFIASEAASERPGAATVISRLADILFIHIVRGYLVSVPQPTTGWLGALAHGQIGAVLGLIHQNPERQWTVANLASEVGMSRSAFASHFARLVGEPPLHYVTRWRMAKATGLLRDGSASLSEVARRVGYDSETAFSKAFKRSVGRSPGAYRRAVQSGAPAAAE